MKAALPPGAHLLISCRWYATMDQFLNVTNVTFFGKVEIFLRQAEPTMVLIKPRKAPKAAFDYTNDTYINFHFLKRSYLL